VECTARKARTIGARVNMRSLHGKSFLREQEGDNMGKKKRRRRSRFSISTVFKFMRLGALVAPGLGAAARHRGESMGDQIAAALKLYAGIHHGAADEKFNWGALSEAWTPFVAVTLVTYGVQKLGGIIRKL